MTRNIDFSFCKNVVLYHLMIELLINSLNTFTIWIYFVLLQFFSLIHASHTLQSSNSRELKTKKIISKVEYYQHSSNWIIRNIELFLFISNVQFSNSFASLFVCYANKLFFFISLIHFNVTTRSGSQVKDWMQ